ncbi:uncharacterized protein LOC114578354 [Dendrobium catenatum]|uniref:F-type H+-transporting ATPase subunit delta n=1 Tax=Dendrobium catenatum TaxID=906689 RepID=A0A2I0WIP8_9ASPA|nr:uncharacterized protein LOC114578354 [Dendrobium catenatum]PKU75545.1 F-type H+-transporting ATPase subunit delta [Dendrobium catenatum]
MDVLASPVSSLLLPSNHRETLHLLKSPLSSSYSNLSSSKPNPRFSLSSSSSKPLVFLCASSTPPPPPSTLAARTHHRAATGYAAALIDFSRRGGAKSLAAIADDVHRLATSIASIIADSSKVDEERAAAVRAALESGGFDRRLVALVRMLVAKNMGVEGVADVLEEFGRIWREMTLPAVEEVDVVVASERKMGIEQLAKVAGEVRRASGAVQVNMKHFFRRRSPRFAV